MDLTFTEYQFDEAAETEDESPSPAVEQDDA